MTLTALMKLSDRFEDHYNQRIEEMLAPFETSCSLQGQQRACEYTELLKSDYDMIRENLLDRMPPLDIDNAKARRAEEEGDHRELHAYRAADEGERRLLSQNANRK